MPKPCTVEASAELLAYLFAQWPELKKKQIRTWLKFQAITVNDRPVSQFDHPLVPGDVVAVRTDRFAIPKTTLASGMKVLFEDATLIVIDKPEDLLSVASVAEGEKTAYFQLTDYIRRDPANARERIWIVHRLDRETSGLMVFAKTPEAKATLQGLGAGHEALRSGGGRKTAAACGRARIRFERDQPLQGLERAG